MNPKKKETNMDPTDISLKPQQDYLLCKQRNQIDCQKEENGLVYVEQQLPEYEIVEIAERLKNKSSFKVGDVILSNAIPTKAQGFFLIKEENVIGKIS